MNYEQEFRKRLDAIDRKLALLQLYIIDNNNMTTVVLGILVGVLIGATAVKCTGL